MTYEVRLSRDAEAALSTLPRPVASAAIRFMSGDLHRNPEEAGVKLRGALKGLLAARRGQYRIVYRVDHGQNVVSVLQITKV
jgi:mRNA interferase RelE/StbE